MTPPEPEPMHWDAPYIPEEKLDVSMDSMGSVSQEELIDMLEATYSQQDVHNDQTNNRKQTTHTATRAVKPKFKIKMHFPPKTKPTGNPQDIRHFFSTNESQEKVGALNSTSSLGNQPSTDPTMGHPPPTPADTSPHTPHSLTRGIIAMIQGRT